MPSLGLGEADAVGSGDWISEHINSLQSQCLADACARGAHLRARQGDVLSCAQGTEQALVYYGEGPILAVRFHKSLRFAVQYNGQSKAAKRMSGSPFRCLGREIGRRQRTPRNHLPTRRPGV